MRFLNNKVVIGSLCFILGAASMFVTQRLWWKAHPSMRGSSLFHSARNMNSFFDDSFGDDFFQMRKNMLKHFNTDEADDGGGMFDSWFGRKFGGGSVADVSKREDDQFVYYDIAVKGLKDEKVNVRVEDGQITISGQVENKTDDEGGASFTSSRFHRSFPVPYGVDPNRVQMTQEKDRLVVKFPKVKT